MNRPYAAYRGDNTETNLRLTDIVVRSLPPPERGAKVYPDDQIDGFGVRVSQGGTKAFVLTHGRSRERITLGRYPIVSLADARAEAKRLLAERTLGKHRLQRMSFEDALRLYVTTHLIQKTRPITAKGTEALIRNHFGRLKGKSLEDVRAQDITAVTDKLLAKSQPGAAGHAFTAIKGFLRWSVRRRYLQHDPIEGIESPAKAVSRERVLDDAELRQVLAACRTDGVYGRFVRLLALTGQRRGEIAALERAWINPEAQTITLPKQKTKNHRDHTFRRMVIRLRNSWKCCRKKDCFSPPAGGTCHSRGFSKSKRVFDKACSIEPWTLHDLRRTFATGLQRLGVRIEVTESLLNHVSGTRAGIVGIYQRHGYLEEMRAAVTLWENHIESILKPE